MTILRNKRKLAAINRETHGEYPRKNQARYSNSPGMQQDYFTQVSEEIECRMTNKLSQEFSRTESCILSALSMPYEVLLNPQARVHSRFVPETSRNSNRENQGTNEDRSQNDPHPSWSVCLPEPIITGIKPGGDFLQY